MKKVFLILFLALIIISCGENKDNKKNSATETVTLKDGPIALEYKFNRNDKFSYKMKTLAMQTQSVKTDSTVETKIEQIVEYVFDFDVVDVDAEKISEFNVTISDIKVEVTANNKKFTYKAGTPVKEEDKKNFVEYEAMYNTPFRIRIDKIGEIVEVTRINKIVDNILKLQGVNDSVTVQEKQQFATNLSESAIKPLVQQLFRRTPTQKINTDSTWVFKYPSNLMVYKVENTTVYKVKSFQKMNDKLIANIDLNLQTIWTGNNTANDRGIAYTFGEPKISGSGNILFNVDRGLVQKSETGTKLEISVTMKANAPRPMKAIRKDVTENKNYIELIK